MDYVRIVYAEMLSRGPEHSPFAAFPDWLKAAVTREDVKLSHRGARDYAVLDVETPVGTMEAGPGDFITHDRGSLGVRRG